ncbi:CDC45 family [Myxozyma melibiosi]|uniref:CDC45 family n=1 Tax=Myxozyma melibiosi TaxID=54550 RepID=A0ABR1F754_9ASCO
MYVSPASYAEAFEALRAAALSHTSCRVVLFVACLDVDALCGARILSGIFKRDLIPHRTCPVAGYSELKKRYAELEDSVTSVILIGCGALVDLNDYLLDADLEAAGDDDDAAEISNRRIRRKLYIFDSHRPWNLQNMFGSEEVVCFDDGDVDDGLLNKERDAFEALLRIEDDDEADEADEDKEEDDSDGEDDPNDEQHDDSDEEENDSDLESNADSLPSKIHNVDLDVRHKRKIFSKSESDDDGDDSASEDRDSGVDREYISSSNDLSDSPVSHRTTPSKRKSPSSRSPSPAPQRQKSFSEARRTYEEVIGDYYGRGTSNSTPVASQIYTLLSFLGLASNPDLWLSVVGTTAVEYASPQLYRRFFPLLRDEVLRLNSQVNISRLSADDSALVVQPDYRLFLLRHWSLYESVVHSPYVASRLHLWNDAGRKKLHKMLAKMGISLQVAKEKWTHTDVALKRALKDKLSSVADVNGIGNVVRTGVVRKFGFRGMVSAGDAVEGVAALMECGKGATINDKESVYQSSSAEENIEEVDGEFKEVWIGNFWTAWDALDNIELLLHGLQRAQILQQAVVRTATALLEKDQVHDLRSFRLIILKDGPDLELFNNPLTLVRLAYWVNECKSEQTDRHSPMVMAVLDQKRDTYTVVGLPARVAEKTNNEDEGDLPEEEAASSNSFGIAFQEMANLTHARVKIDSFESSVVEVRKDDLTGFLEGMSSVGIK